MGFKLPGKSIHSGTSAHSSALKMKAESNAAAKMKREAAAKMKMEAAAKMKKGSPMDKALIGDQKNLPEELKAKIEASPAKASEFGAEYRKNRDAGKKYFTYKGKEYTTESRSEKAKREKTGKTYAELNPRKSMTKTVTTKKDDPLTEEIKDTSDVKKMGPKTQKQTIKKEKQDVKDVRKSGKESVKSAKKQKRINILKEKKDVSDAKGKTRRSKRLERKIERKETGVTRREQRQRDKEQESSSPATMKEGSKRTKRLVRKEANETAKIVDGTKTSARKVNRLVDKIKVSKARDEYRDTKKQVKAQKKADRKSAKNSIAAG